MPYMYDDAVTEIQNRLYDHLLRLGEPTRVVLCRFDVADSLKVERVEAHVTYDYPERSWFMAVVVGDERRAVAKIRTPIDRMITTHAPEVIHAELTALVEEALWGAQKAPKPEPAILPGELTFGEVRSALVAGTLARIAPVAHLLSEMGEKWEDLREYARHQLDHSATLPWPVGWVGYDGPDKIGSCVPALLCRPQGIVHGGGDITRRRAHARATAPKGGTQRHAADLRLIGLDGPVRDVPRALTRDFERQQWLGMQAKLIELLLTYQTPTSQEALYLLQDIPLDEYFWSRSETVAAVWRDMQDKLDRLDGGLRTVLDRVREAMSYGPSLHGLAYATWAAAAPLSWGVYAHCDGIWPTVNRTVWPQHVKAINDAIVQPAIHVELRRLMEVGR